MAVTGKWFTKTIANAFGGETELEDKRINWLDDTIKVALFTDDLSIDPDTMETWADLDYEVEGDGYSSGGQALTNKSISSGSVTGVTSFTADPVNWSDSSITARYAVIYDDTPASDSSKCLIGYIDFGSNKTSSNGDFTITWHSDGILVASTV